MKRSTFMPIAHRGASTYAPENTFAAFDLALQMGARHVELDVHETADRAIVVIHDNTLDRTTDGAGPVAGCSWDDLKKLDAGSWFDPRFTGERVPAFAEVLERYAGLAHLHTEVKSANPGFVKRLIDEIHQHGAERSVTITAFAFEHVAEARRHAPDLPTGWLVTGVTEDIVLRAKAAGIEQLCPKASTVTPEIVQLLHNQGFTVRVWGVPSEEVMRAALAAGVDGMTVNYPDRLIQLLKLKSPP
jgi:glycerophosphoryl diester phosphodiesterase